MKSLERQTVEAYKINSPDWYGLQLRIALRTSKDSDPLLAIINGARKEVGPLFAGKEGEFEILLNELSSQQYKDNDELIKMFAESISKFAQSNFQLTELEERARAPERLREDQIKLNDLLFFNLGRNDKTKIKLHVFPASTLSIGEKIKQFREGLQELSRLLTEHPKFAQVKTVMARSWIVLKNPEIFKMLGFQILEENEKDRMYEVHRAVISRKDFEKKYGKINSNEN